MDVQTNQIPGTSAQNSQISANGSEPVITSDFETFLKMLTAQMENQDPLNPLDSQDFATQLATFSGVEQQVLTNDLLETLSSNLGGSGLVDMASWIGKEARIAAPVPFDGTPIEILPQPPIFSDSATLVVANAAGDVVQRVPIDTSGDPILWEGRDENGLPFADGTYAFSVEASTNGEIIDTSVPEAYASIREVRIQDGSNMIVFQNGDLHPSQNVTSLR